MSEEIQIPEAPKLREPEETRSAGGGHRFTFDAPHILTQASIEGGAITYAVRQGMAVQCEWVTRLEWSLEPVDEKAKEFMIRAQNRIRFAGQTISVINDAVELDGLRLIASSPTASEYLALSRQQVMIRFKCSRDIDESRRLGVPVYKTSRTFITLP